MIREIRKKIIVLGNRLPFAQHTKDYIDHLERIDWIYMNLALDGSPLTRQICRIIAHQFLRQEPDLKKRQTAQD